MHMSTGNNEHLVASDGRGCIHDVPAAGETRAVGSCLQMVFSPVWQTLAAVPISPLATPQSGPARFVPPHSALSPLIDADFLRTHNKK